VKLLGKGKARLEDWLLELAGPGGAFSAGLQNLKNGRLGVAAEGFADAERLYIERYGRSHPRVSQAIAFRAWCLANSGRPADAVGLYEEAIELERGHVDGARAQQLIEQLAWARGKLEGEVS
jgi:tetratricopeptide (TPR) repeat protein